MHMQFNHNREKQTILTQDSERNRLLTDITLTKNALHDAYAGFDNAVDPDLIDCYIYEVNSILKRYKYLLAQAEKLNMTTDKDPALCPKPPVYSLIG